MVMPRIFFLEWHVGLVPVRALTVVDFPWATWPRVPITMVGCLGGASRGIGGSKDVMVSKEFMSLE